MENVRNFSGNRVTRVPRALRPVQPTQVLTNSYGTHYNTYTRGIRKHTDYTSCKNQFLNLNLRTYEPPKTIANRILDSTHDILDTARAITNLAPAQTTASPQRERQTSQTGKGGAHDQDSLRHHHQTTRKPHYDQQISPQRERQPRLSASGRPAKPAWGEPTTKIPSITTTKPLAHHTTTNKLRPSTTNTIATFKKEPQQSRVQTISNDPSSNPDILQATTGNTQCQSRLAIQRRRGQAATGRDRAGVYQFRRLPSHRAGYIPENSQDTRTDRTNTAISEQPYTNPPPTVATKMKKALMAQQRGEMQSKREQE